MFLIDYLRNNHSVLIEESDCPEYSRQHVIDSLKSSVHIDVQNIQDFMSTKEAWGYQHVPFAKPPFPNLFIESEVPPIGEEAKALGLKIDCRLTTKRGVLVLSGDGKSDVNTVYANFFSGVFQRHPSLFHVVRHDAVAIFKTDKNGSIIKDYNNNSIYDRLKRSFGVIDKEFDYSIKFYDMERLESKLTNAQQKDCDLKMKDGRRMGDVYYSSIRLDLIRALLTFSFMNCKNVSLATRREGGAPLLTKKGSLPTVKTYTLTISPIKKILENRLDKNSQLTPRSFHICAGHFKDFSNGRGLFGKYKGTYWWPMAVRGDRKYGEIIKNYKIGHKTETPASV